MNCINRVISSQKSCHVLGLPSPNTYGMNFSNEELKINFGQAAAKISEVKVGGKKNLPDLLGPGCISLESDRVGNFLSISNFDL